MAKKVRQKSRVRQISSKLIRVGSNIYPAFQLEDGKWYTAWPDGAIRTCSPEEVYESILDQTGAWYLKRV